MTPEQRIKVDEWLIENNGAFSNIDEIISHKDGNATLDDWETFSHFESKINGFIECLLILEPEYYTNRFNGEVQGKEEGTV